MKGAKIFPGPSLAIPALGMGLSMAFTGKFVWI